MGTWLKDRPGDKDSFATTVPIVQDNLDAIEDLFGQEHNTFSETACGTHISGVMGVVASASTVGILTLTSPGTGAVAWDTTVGSWKRYWGDTWAVPGSATKWSRCRAYANSNQELALETLTNVTFSTEDYDSLNEFAGNTFTALDAGYYLAVASISISGQAVGEAPSLGLALLKSGTIEASASKGLQQPGVETDVSILIVAVVQLSIGSTLTVQAYKTKTADTIIAGTDKTYLAIHRLGSQMM